VTHIGEATFVKEGLILAPPGIMEAPQSWFAVQTKPRHEKRVARDLEEKGVAAFLPMLSEVHQWSDRKRQVELPLFTTYVFVQISADRSSRVKVLETNGVFCFVGARGIGIAIPDGQIETIQAIVREKVPCFPYPFVTVGQKVRIRGGSLDGICGMLSAINNDRSLIVSVDSIQKSLAIRIDGGYGVDPI
jgi:transcription termination/antitermination protein NusG